MTTPASNAKPGRAAPLSGGRLRGLLFALPSTTFAAQCHYLALTPFLVDIAAETHTDLATTGQLMAWMALGWGVAALLGGGLSDRFGRKPVLLGGLSVLSVASLGSALAQDYLPLLLSRLVGGLGGGTMMPAVFAIVADVFPRHERGRGLGWTMAGMSMSQVAGVPLVTFMAGLAGWRWSVGGLSLVTLLLVPLAVLLVPSPARRPGPVSLAATSPLASLGILRQPRVFLVLLSSFTERLGFGAVAVYLASYLIASYGVPYNELAWALMLVASGNLLGTLLGGRLADRTVAKAELTLASLVGMSVAGTAAMLIQPGVWPSAALGVVWGLSGALGRPAFFWIISEISREARGAVMGMHVSLSSFSWLIAAFVGGLLIAAGGFNALAAFIAISGVLSAGSVGGLVVLLRRGRARTVPGPRSGVRR